MKNSALWIILILAPLSVWSQDIEGGRIHVDSRNFADVPGSQEQIHQKTKDWFGTNFGSPEEIINEDLPDRISASYYDDCTVGDKRVFFNHDMVIQLNENKVIVELWIRDRKDKDKTAREFFYKKDNTVKNNANKPLSQLITKGQYFITELEEYLRSN